MNSAFQNWLWLIGIGLVFSWFMRPRTVLLVTGVLFAVCLAGLMVSSSLSLETEKLLFAIVAFILCPALAVVGLLGSFASRAFRTALKLVKKDERGNRP